MRFTFDNETHTVQAHGSMAVAARYVINQLGLVVNYESDYVKLALSHTGENERFVILNFSQAFASIAVSDDGIAQELAEKFERAINEFYA
ncbi:hypothetical protein [Vibrio aquimaris]|uniref:Uncharacterized protein n=1 Tax=Vibrio aquimaris TaxID=2587862 RepID=A0A5P9CRB8_9VIBR|nr:hypothetical protein [Vibrio aquimaris]QFT28809.1 hypothetical protein FIV01_20620 [Vibrio aquimaris]